MGDLKNLLRDVLRDDELRVRLKQNPELVFSEYNLTTVEEDAIRTGNEIEINRLAAECRNEASENEVYAKASENEVYAKASENEVYAKASENEVYVSQD